MDHPEWLNNVILAIHETFTDVNSEPGSVVGPGYTARDKQISYFGASPPAGKVTSEQEKNASGVW